MPIMSVAGEATVSQQPQASTPLEVLWANSSEVLFQADEQGRLHEVNQAFSDLFADMGNKERKPPGGGRWWISSSPPPGRSSAAA